MKRLFTGIAAVILLFVGAAPASAQSETIEYYGLDALGSVRVIFDQQGNVVDRMDYDPFGANLRAAIKFPTEQFAELARDGESGQDYAQARNYSSETGRFNRVDPLYTGLFTPQRWNRYSYSTNRPLNLIDPDGRNPIGAATVLGVWCAFTCPTGSSDGALGSASNPFRSGTIGNADDAMVEATATEAPDFSWSTTFGWLDTTQAVLDVAAGVLDLTGVGQVVSPVVELANAGISLARGNTTEAGVTALAAVPIIGTPATVAKAGQRIYRVFGGEAGMLGRYWTTVDPRTLSDVTGQLGLYPGNTADRMVTARLLQDATLTVADPGPATRAGTALAPQILFPNGVGNPNNVIVFVTGISPFGGR